MRRLLSISITVLLGLMLAAPLFADASSGLPQCCRRNGVHHCADWMAGGGTERSVTRVGTGCPAFPKATAAPTHHDLAMSAVGGAGSPVFVHPAAAPQTEARYRVGFARSRQKRGPPSAALGS